MKNKIITAITAITLAASMLISCGENEIKLPENENEEIIINENYASSNLMEFEGTVDEIYDDGSMLIYSPIFGMDFNYNVIVELDENTVIDNFEVNENQLVNFSVYSAVKKSKPLTVVAAKLTLISNNSNQRAEEEEYQKNLQDAAENLGDKIILG